MLRSFRPIFQLFPATLCLFLVSCGDTDPEADFDEGPTRDTTSAVSISPGEHGPSFDGVATTIVTPTEGEVVTGDSLEVVIEQSGVELMAPTSGEGANGLAYSKDGQHLHVIIDHEPYMAMYNVPFKIGGLAPGTRTMIVFPSRSWHESVKNPGSVAVRKFVVETPEPDDGFDPEGPTLVYSRPKGEYIGKDAARVLLDFYLLNVELSAEGYRVIASVDGGKEVTITDWKPYFIEGLTDGEHTIRLRLVDAEGATVTNGPYGEAERTITVASKATPAVSAETADEKGEEDEDGADLEKDLFDAGRHVQGL